MTGNGKNDSAIDDVERVEREFVESMDAMQEYVELQGKLQQQLKQGLMSLARAKYSMGGRPLGQDQYDPAMVATTRCLVLPGSEPSGSASGSFGGKGGQGRQDAGQDGGVGETAAGGSGRRSFTVHRIAIPPPPPRVAAGTENGKVGDEGVAGSGGAKGVTGSSEAASGTSATSTTSATGTSKRVVAGKAASGKRSGGGDKGGDTAGLEDALLEELDLEDEDEEWEEEAELREAQELLRRLRMEAEAAQRGSSSSGSAGAAGTSEGASGAGPEGKGNGTSGQQENGEADAKVGAGLPRRKQGARRVAAAPRDPLQWFGVMVPPALREAQSEFAKVVETCVQLATTAQRIRPVA